MTCCCRCVHYCASFNSQLLVTGQGYCRSISLQLKRQLCIHSRLTHIQL
jgi:hypothetical protein